MLNQKMSQELTSHAAGLHSLSRTATTYNTASVDMAVARQVLFIIDSGNAGTATGTIDFKLQGSAVTGSGMTDIASTSITQLTADGKFAFVCVNDTWLQSLGLGYRFIQGKLTVGSATTVCSVTVLGADTRFEPASAQNVAAVLQIFDLSV